MEGLIIQKWQKKCYYLPIPSCLFRPRLSRTGFLLSPTYPHLRLCEKMRGAGIMATRLGFCWEAGPLGREVLTREQCSGRCHHSYKSHVASSHFQPNIFFINIKRKCFWLLRKQLYKMCKYNDHILSTVDKISCMENRRFYPCFLSFASVTGNENIDLRGLIKIKFTAFS